MAGRDSYRSIQDLVQRPEPEPSIIEAKPPAMENREEYSGIKMTYPSRPAPDLLAGISPWTWFLMAFIGGCWFGSEILSYYLLRVY